MALVVLLRGINVGGHRSCRPSVLATRLKHLGVINIGAAGTFVVRGRVSQARLRAEFARRLPFNAQIVIFRGRDLAELMARRPFGRRALAPDVVRFVSVLSTRPRSAPTIPMSLPSRGTWLVRILARDGRFVCGLYRRHMKVIGYLGAIDRLFGVPVTTRNWNTIRAIVTALDADKMYSRSSTREHAEPA